MTREASCTTDSLDSAQGDDQDGVRDDSQIEWEHEFQVNECSEGEMAGDEWWDLEPDYPGLEEGGAKVPQTGPPQRLPHGVTRPPRPTGAGQQRLRKRPRVTTDQQWEEARRNAWLRQVLSDGSSDEDEDEERHGRFAESGDGCQNCTGSPNIRRRPQEGSVPDSKSRNIPEVVLVRRGAVGVLGIWKGWDSWVKGGANGVSLQATGEGGGRFLLQLEGAK